MKKIKYLISAAIVSTALVVAVVMPAIASAHGNDWVEPPQVEACGYETKYTKEHDYDGTKVNINFQDSDEAITVTAKTGYELVSVKLDVDFDWHVGLYLYPVIDGVKFNPDPGKDIDEAEVVVKKVCKEVCNDSTATNYEAVVEGESTANNELCKKPEVLAATTVAATPAATQVAAPVSGVKAGAGGADAASIASLLGLGGSLGATSLGLVVRNKRKN